MISLKTFQQDWSYRHPEADVISSVAQLQAWFHTLDNEMKMAVLALEGQEMVTRFFVHCLCHALFRSKSNKVVLSIFSGERSISASDM
jgi:hypothetical protein